MPGPTLVAFLLTSTSLGAVLSVLRERELLHEPYGQLLMVTTAVADFGTTLLLAVFLVKAVPAWLHRRLYSARECLAAGVLLSAQLTFTIAGVEIGKSLGTIDEALGSALVIVALLSVMIAPVAFARLQPRVPAVTPRDGPAA